MRGLVVDYGQASKTTTNLSHSLEYLKEELDKINGAISEIEALNISYSRTNTILDELYEQKRLIKKSYDEMEEFTDKLSKFINNVKTTDKVLAKKFKGDIKTYCKSNEINMTSQFEQALDIIQGVLDGAGFIPIFGNIPDGINALISLCRGNYLETVISLIAMLPLGDMLKTLKYSDDVHAILKTGDNAINAVKTIAKESAEKLNKQMDKLIRSGKLDNINKVIDIGTEYFIRFSNDVEVLINKTFFKNDLALCLETGTFKNFDNVISKPKVNFIEAVGNTTTKKAKEFKRFYDEDSVMEWGTVFDDWSFDLLDEEADAIANYTESRYYRNINSVLRGFEEKFHEGNAEIVENIRSALSKCDLPEDIIVHRITSQNMLGAIKELPIDKMVNKIIDEKAFMSTSLLEESNFVGDLKLIIEAEKGSKAAYIADLSRCFTEYEVLFDKGQQMRIKKASKLENGQLELVVKILNK